MTRRKDPVLHIWHVTDAFGNDHTLSAEWWTLRGDKVAVFLIGGAEVACFTEPVAVLMCTGHGEHDEAAEGEVVARSN
jgi:hypothetical protein